MVIRTFLDKNNTILYNKITNTGKNPVAELFYGGSYETNSPIFTRFLFQFDIQRIIELRTKGMFPDLTKLKHTLRMTNTGTFDDSLLGTETGDNKNRANSFNLNLFEIPQTWDEGVGYDFSGQKYFSSSDASVVSYGPSNWKEAQTGIPWDNGSGVFTGWTSTSIVGSQHFEDGNENLEIDISDIVNGYLTGMTNNGLGLAFDESLETSIVSSLQYVGFFTRHTQTFYEPYVETKYLNSIKDDRANFYLNKKNKLYLYVNAGGIPTDVDSMSTMGVLILNNIEDTYASRTSSDITHEGQGIYSIELIIPTTDIGCVLYEDIWSGIIINGISIPDIELSFELKNSDGYYNVGSDATTPKNYKFNVSGISSSEKINRGDVRKVRVNAKVPYTTNQQEVLDLLEYRLYVKEGNAEYTVIDYTSVDRAFNYNFFLLDTQSLVPQRYYLDIKAISNYEVKTTKNVISFDIVSQVDKRVG